MSTGRFRGNSAGGLKSCCKWEQRDLMKWLRDIVPAVLLIDSHLRITKFARLRRAVKRMRFLI
jgi:hypothetical protein